MGHLGFPTFDTMSDALVDALPLAALIAAGARAGLTQAQVAAGMGADQRGR